ncbi:protein kinase domain-containing protein [Luteimonas sp. A537]
MDADALAHWQAADAAFGQWLDLPEGDRGAWLAALDLPDPVRHRLDQLIAAHVRPSAALASPGSDLAGVQLGAWTLETELGRGGMAVVYRASRSDGIARQDAALKVLTLGALGITGHERFQREAEILARLNHPNITPLVDSGVSGDGTCWLAMPLVEGERIDLWCESHTPDAPATVRLYLQVCDAIAYAHRNLVIHRDLKPSNVLVEADGHVRLLDFGIGQFTDAQDERTQTMWRALTPGYAAPEQLRGDPPSTAIDVYGLGALLHRLLTGRTPEGGDGANATRPSQLVRASSDAWHRHYVPLRNDLDRVLLKALAEEPQRRYPSAEAFAADLRRWLEGRPVLAQSPTLGYRARKFIGRNRLGVVGAVLLAASLAGGIGATLWQAREAQKAAENAQVQAQRATLVRDFLEEIFMSTQPTAGEVPDALDLLEEGSRRARSALLADDPVAAADILLLTGAARMHLSRYELGEQDLLAALDLLDTHAHPDIGARERVLVHMELSEIYRNTGRIDEAIAASNRAASLAIANRLAEEDVFDARLSVAQANAFHDPASAEAITRQLLEDALTAGHANSYVHRDIVATLGVVMVQNDHDRADVLPIMEEELRLSRELEGEDSGWYAYRLAGNSGTFLLAGRPDRAREMLDEAVRIVDTVYREPHQLAANIHCNMGTQLHLTGDPEPALHHYDQGVAIGQAVGRKNLAASECIRYRSILRATLGDLVPALEDLDQAESLRVLNANDQTSIGRSICGMRASIRLRLGDVAGADDALEQCQAGADAGQSHIYALAEAEVRMAQGKLREAGALAAGLRESVRRGLDNSWMRPWMLSMLLAKKTADADALAALATEAAAFLDDAPPIARCLAEPVETHCLALP